MRYPVSAKLRLQMAVQNSPGESHLPIPAPPRGGFRRHRLVGVAATVAAIGLGLWWWWQRLPAAGQAGVAALGPARPAGQVAPAGGPARPGWRRESPASPQPAPATQDGASGADSGARRSGPRREQEAAYALSLETPEPGTQDLALTVASYALTPLQAGGWAVALDDALPLAVKGEPALPFVRHDVLLGSASALELEVVAAEWEEAACPPLLASPGFVSRSAAPTAAALVARQVAGRFPDSPARLTPVYRWRGLRGVGVILCPFRYDATAGVLGVCRRLQVRLRGAATPAELAGLPTSTLALAAQRWPEQTKAVTAALAEPVVQESLLVLVPESLSTAPALAEFVLWKEQRGVAVSLQPLTGSPSVSTVRGLIRSFAEGKERANVLLLGAAAAIPPAQASAPPSDTLYALLDGSADRYHDLSISRLTVTSPGDLEVQLGRSVLYERWQWPSPSTDGTWCSAATTVASNENQGNLGLLDREAMESVRQELLSSGYSPCDDLYDLPGFSPDCAALANAWNRGRGLVLYLGHGLQSSWRTTGFAAGDVERLLRYGAALPFVVSAACHTGNFTLASDCLCQAFLKGGSAQAPTGGIGAIGGTGTLDWDPPVVMLQSFSAYLTRQAQFTSGGLTFSGGAPRTTAGELTFAAVQRSVDFCLATPGEGDAAARRMVEQVHLFGDPTLGIRSRVPTALRVSHSEKAVGGVPFELTAQDAATGQGIAGLTVCLHGPDNVQWLGLTAAAGHATVAVPPDAVPETLTVTVYAPDVIPYQAELEMQAPSPPLRVVTSSLPAGCRGVYYEATLEAGGGDGGSLTWSTASVLPEGLVLAPDGTLSGVPSEAGTWHLDIRVVAAGEPTQSAAAEFELLLENPVPPVSRFGLVLQPGWNLISLPLDVAAEDFPAALLELGLRRCDARGQVRGVMPPLPALVAYWVYAPTQISVELVGRDLADPAPILTSGWNACGVGQTMALAGLPGTPSLAWVWTAAGWEPVRTDLLPGQGYLVFARP